MATQPIDRKSFKHQIKTLRVAPQLVNRTNKQTLVELSPLHVVLYRFPCHWLHNKREYGAW